MSIYKTKFRCIDCRNLWVENAPDDLLAEVKPCPFCKGDSITISLYNDSIANIDDEMGEEN